jgi:hypothetical protein
MRFAAKKTPFLYKMQNIFSVCQKNSLLHAPIGLKD